MPADDRRIAARARLAARYGAGLTDAELAAAAISHVTNAVTARGALEEDAAYEEVERETVRMRRERRERGRVTAGS